jgi:hypothetical protein
LCNAEKTVTAALTALISTRLQELMENKLGNILAALIRRLTLMTLTPTAAIFLKEVREFSRGNNIVSHNASFLECLKSQVSDREFASSGFCVLRSGSCE